jgi:hypothetical protein
MNLAICAVLGFCLANAPSLTESPSFRELIAQLGDADFNLREAANQKLAADPTAAPFVRRAVSSNDPEVSNRARSLISGYQKLRLAEAVDGLRLALKLGQAELFLEWYLLWRPDRPEELWQPGFDLGQAVVLGVKRLLPANVQLGGEDQLPKSLDHLKKMDRGSRLRMHDGAGAKVEGPDCWLIRTDQLDRCPSSLVALAVARGPVSNPEYAQNVLFSLDRVTAEHAITSSVVVCTGDTRLAAGPFRHKPGVIESSAIVTRGQFVGPSSRLLRSVILTGGTVDIGEGCELIDSTIIAGGKVSIPKSATVKNCRIEQGVKNPTAPFSFFELADVGLSLDKPAAADAGLPVADVKPDTPFGKAGVKKGDVLLAIDDQKVGDAEAFRVTLRKAVVQQGDALMTVSRGGKTLDLAVYFPLPK